MTTHTHTPDEHGYCIVCGEAAGAGHEPDLDAQLDTLGKSINGLIAENAELVAALERAADTLADYAKGHEMLGRTVLAKGCRIAEQDARAALAKAKESR